MHVPRWILAGVLLAPNIGWAQTATSSAAGAAAASEPTPELPLVRGLSWNVLGGGIPASGALAQLEMGFSSLRGAYHHSLARGFSIGGMVGLDYDYFTPRKPVAALLLAAPIRYAFLETEQWSGGLRADPGLFLGFSDPFVLGFLLNVGANLLMPVDTRILVGGGMELPVLFGIPTGDGVDPFLVVPILVGPVAELHLMPPLAITLDAKAGPYLSTAEDLRFGLKLMASLTYRL